MAKRIPKLPEPKVEQQAVAPYPHANLGTYLKMPKGGEYVTSHHRGAKKPTGNGR